MALLWRVLKSMKQSLKEVDRDKDNWGKVGWPKEYNYNISSWSNSCKASSITIVNGEDAIFGHCCPRSPSAEYWMAETATWWGCSFISISEEASRKILRVPSLYPAATHALSLLEEGLQHTQPQTWPTEKNRRGWLFKGCVLFWCTVAVIVPSYVILSPTTCLEKSTGNTLKHIEFPQFILDLLIFYFFF